MDEYKYGTEGAFKPEYQLEGPEQEMELCLTCNGTCKIPCAWEGDVAEFCVCPDCGRCYR